MERIAEPSEKARLPVDAAIDDVKERLNARRTQRRSKGRLGRWCLRRCVENMTSIPQCASHGCIAMDWLSSAASITQPSDESRIVQKIVTGHENASDSLQAGGSQYGVDDSRRVDIEHLIPLCDRIEREYAAECLAILYDNDSEGTFTIDILGR